LSQHLSAVNNGNSHNCLYKTKSVSNGCHGLHTLKHLLDMSVSTAYSPAVCTDHQIIPGCLAFICDLKKLMQVTGSVHQANGFISIHL